MDTSRAHLNIDFTGATLTHSEYGDPLTRQKGLNPYQRFPERSDWTEVEVWTLADGSTVRLHRDASRWAGSFSMGKWQVVQQVTYRVRCTRPRRAPLPPQVFDMGVRTEWLATSNLDHIARTLNARATGGDHFEVEAA